jgi:uncharacterized protein (DUF924 family)
MSRSAPSSHVAVSLRKLTGGRGASPRRCKSFPHDSSQSRRAGSPPTSSSRALLVVALVMDRLPSRALPSIDEVLAFWFDDSGRWWKKDPAFDAEVRDRFLDLYDRVMRDEREDWLETSRGTLAYVIVLDQFSRNMFRGSRRMFESDPRALAAAHSALDRGFDRGVSSDERMFLYMPFMHSEDIADQDRCAGLFASALPKWLPNAEEHRDIIRRFGRFPHRNALLGRRSTAEELEFLKRPGSSF